MTDPRFAIRPIQKDDDPALERLIRTVMPEFGASGAGFAIHDTEVSSMFEAYARNRSAYFVLTADGEVVGGAGIGPLSGAGPEICELRKMYLLPQARGRGHGRRLLDASLAAAKSYGYARCYLETLKSMSAANELYRNSGFAPLSSPLGNTGHFGCDAWYVKSLRDGDTVAE